MVNIMENIVGLYPDELLYSCLSRNVQLLCCRSMSKAIFTYYGKSSCVPIVNFASNLDSLIKFFPESFNYNVNTIIQKATLFPLYSPFLVDERKENIISIMKSSSANGLMSLLGIQAGQILKKSKFKYCPLCYKEDVSLYGQGYLHRIHNVDGVLICNKHLCILNEYKNKDKTPSRREFIQLKPTSSEMVPKFLKNADNIFDKLLVLTNSVQKLLSVTFNDFNFNFTLKKYYETFYKNKLLTTKETVKQQELCGMFKEYYSEDFLNLLNCNLDINNMDNWIRTLFRNRFTLVNPIKHILLILMFYGDVNNFFTQSELSNCFGEGPWPCLNSASFHYKENTITKVIISEAKKSKIPIGTFRCSCGFIYSRIGTDNDISDKYRFDIIDSYGDQWEAKLRELYESKKHSIKQISREMQCSVKEVRNNLLRIDLYSSIKQYQKLIKSTTKRDEYRNCLIKLTECSPKISRTQIQEKIKKEFYWLNKYDKDWLYEHLPVKQFKKTHNGVLRIDWHKRDVEILNKIKESYQAILAKEKPIRITFSIVGEISGLRTMLEQNIQKLPQTKEYISKVLESVEDFQKRRIDYVCRSIIKNQGSIKNWEVIKFAHLKPKFVNGLEEYIMERIELLKEFQ